LHPDDQGVGYGTDLFDNYFKVISTNMNNLQTTNIISISLPSNIGNGKLYNIGNNYIIGNMPNNIFTGNIIVDNYDADLKNGVGEVYKLLKTKKIIGTLGTNNTISFKKTDLSGFTGKIRIMVELNYDPYMYEMMNYSYN